MTYECYCDGDPPTVFRRKTVRARKQHTCTECHCRIHAGEQHEYVFGIWDGDAAQYRTCQLCVELHDWATTSVSCFCRTFGNLHSEARELVSELRRDVPGFLFEWGRRMVKIRRHAAASREVAS